MIYRDFKGEKLSALGMGCMRLPTVGGDRDSAIREDEVREMVACAMKNGINYYDTAWGYHAGRSETVIGNCLADYPRGSFNLATKFPGYDVTNFGRQEEIFAEQLRKCRVEYFDYYLLHNVNESNIEYYLNDEKYGVYTYFIKQREAGKIRHLGFSCHGTVETLGRFLDKYGAEMEFCQLQLNWLDWGFQDARGKVELLDRWGIPVWVMEPLRGGKLASVAAEDEARLRAMRPEESVVGWAFRFLQSLPSVTMILSGMSDMEQLRENIDIFAEDKPAAEEERAVLFDIARGMTAGIPCTACRYCTTHCPMELDIPRLISLYNESKFSGGGFIAPMNIAAMPEEKRPSACLACHSCEAVCPQNIAIPDVLAELSEMAERR